MSALINDSDTEQDKTSLPGYPHYLSHQDEPVDAYREFLDDGVTRDSDFRNPRNFFDDLTSKDNKWLKLARKHLRRSEISR